MRSARPGQMREGFAQAGQARPTGEDEGGDSDPVESISLSFAKVLVNYHDYDKKNAGKSPQRTGYDLTTGPWAYPSYTHSRRWLWRTEM